jgi:hypothetical protein
MVVHSLLNALSFDISLIEIGQEIKLLEHFKNKLDHPVDAKCKFFLFIYYSKPGLLNSILLSSMKRNT